MNRRFLPFADAETSWGFNKSTQKLIPHYHLILVVPGVIASLDESPRPQKSATVTQMSDRKQKLFALEDSSQQLWI